MKTKNVTAAVGAFALIALGQAVMSPAANAALPSCLATSVAQSGSRTTVYVYNGCSTTQRFIIKWDLALDSSCLTLTRGAHVSKSKLYSGFEGLKSC